MPEPAWDKSDTKLLFEALFDIRALIAEILDVLEGGGDDGEEAEEADE